MLDLVGIPNMTGNWGADMTLVRKSSVTAPSNVFDFADWDQYPQDTFEYLGDHEMTDESLAIQLFFFSARLDKKQVLLSWSTASESENAGFLIFRQEGNGPMKKIAGWQENAALRGFVFSSQNIFYEYLDKNVNPGATYTYLLASENLQGQHIRHWKQRQTLKIPAGEKTIMPAKVSLKPISPNPFNTSSMIRYTVHENSDIILQVWSLSGNLQKMWIQNNQQSGEYSVALDARDWASGIYIIRLSGNGVSLSQKAILLK